MECIEFFRAAGWRCAAVGEKENVLHVALPITFASGRPCSLYLLEESARQLRLSDDGDTLAHLNQLGYALEDRRRWRGIGSIVERYGFDLNEDGEITALVSRRQLSGHVDMLLQLYAAIAQWERDQFSEGDQDFSLSDEVEQLLHRLAPEREVIAGPSIDTYSGPVEFDFRWGDTYVDALSPSVQSSNSRLRKVVMLRDAEIDALFIIDDRQSRQRAEAERGVLGQVARVQLLSDMQHQATVPPVH